jgi:hypothetical protein
VNGIIESGQRAAPAHHTRAASNDKLARLEVEALPDVPGAVDHGVVDVEGRVVGRGVEVTARVTRDGVVAGTVHAHDELLLTAAGEAGEAAAEAADRLHGILEAADVVGASDQADHVLRTQVLPGQDVGDVAAQAARVVAVAIGTRVARRSGVDDGSHGAEGDDHTGEELVSIWNLIPTGRTIWKAEQEQTLSGGQGNLLLEGAGLHATTTVADGDARRHGVVDLLTIAAERRIAAVEDGRRLGVLIPPRPVPVLCGNRLSANFPDIFKIITRYAYRLGAIVAALSLKGALEGPSVPAVPREEVALYNIVSTGFGCLPGGIPLFSFFPNPASTPFPSDLSLDSPESPEMSVINLQCRGWSWSGSCGRRRSHRTATWRQGTAGGSAWTACS